MDNIELKLSLAPTITGIVFTFCVWVVWDVWQRNEKGEYVYGPLARGIFTIWASIAMLLMLDGY